MWVTVFSLPWLLLLCVLCVEINGYRSLAHDMNSLHTHISEGLDYSLKNSKAPEGFEQTSADTQDIFDIDTSHSVKTQVLDHVMSAYAQNVYRLGRYVLQKLNAI